DSRRDPEKSFDGHQFETRWDDLDLAYVLGEALWTYLNIPFRYNWAGFVTDEITPIQVDGETWRRLQATFPDHIKSHTRQQTSCFGPDGLLRRHGFTIDVIGGAPGRLKCHRLSRCRRHHHPHNATSLRMARCPRARHRAANGRHRYR